MRKSVLRLSVLVALVLAIAVSAPVFAKGGGSNPQFPAPASATWCTNPDGSLAIQWAAVTSICCGQPPAKYAIQIVVTEDTNLDSCASVTSTNVTNLTVPGNQTSATSPVVVDDFTCGVTVLIKALNPPGKSQNNPQVAATNLCI